MEPRLPNAEFAFPGPLRDALVDAILDGSKTSTTSLALQYDDDGGEPLPRPGDRSILIGSNGEPLAVLEVTGIRLVPLGSVDLQHARDEGEGHATLQEWRAAHEDFWHGEEFRSALGEPAFIVDDDTVVLLERFRVIRTVAENAPGATGDAGSVRDR